MFDEKSKVHTIAAAQICSRAGDIAENIRRHLIFMDLARQQGAQCIVFPELSLTGYEPRLADAIAQSLDVEILAPLREYARAEKMMAIVGLPLRSGLTNKPFVAAAVLHPDGKLTVHTKQYLHPGEEHYFSPGHGGDLLRIGDIPLALAICADFTNPAHPAAAEEAGARLYAASVLIGEAGYRADSQLLQRYAKAHNMAVLMANHGGPTGGWASAGASAFWDENGHIVASTSRPGDYLLTAVRNSCQWSGSVMPVNID